MFYFPTWFWDAFEWEQGDKKLLKQVSCAVAFTFAYFKPFFLSAMVNFIVFMLRNPQFEKLISKLYLPLNQSQSIHTWQTREKLI